MNIIRHRRRGAPYLLTGLALLGVSVLLIRAMPDFVRYFRMRRM